MKRSNQDSEGGREPAKRPRDPPPGVADSLTEEEERFCLFQQMRQQEQQAAFVAAQEERNRTMAALAAYSGRPSALELAQQQLAAALHDQRNDEALYRQQRFMHQQHQQRATSAMMADILQRYQSGGGIAIPRHLPPPPHHNNPYTSTMHGTVFAGSSLADHVFLSQRLDPYATSPSSLFASGGALRPGLIDAQQLQQQLSIAPSSHIQNPSWQASLAAANSSDSAGNLPNYAMMLGAPSYEASRPDTATANLLSYGHPPAATNTAPQIDRLPSSSHQETRLSASVYSRKVPKKKEAKIEATYDPGNVKDLSLPSDKGNLSEYQCLLREQILLFSVSVSDLQCSAQGRNKPITLGQVGVLCRHCSRLPPGMRPCGAVYFPAQLSGLYQASQNMAINHFGKSCQRIPEPTRARLLKLKERKSTVLGGGKNFWANGARVKGVIERDGQLRFKDEES